MPSPTLLTMANEVIANVGEKPRTTLSDVAVVNDQVRAAIGAALLSVSTDGQWSWLQQNLLGNAAGVSWSADVATLPNTCHQIRNVLYKNASMTTWKPVEFIGDDEYLVTQNLTAFTNTSNSSNIPLVHTLQGVLGDGLQVRVNPYPNDATTRAFVMFQCTSLMTLPTSPTDSTVIQELPMAYYPLVVLKATAYMMQHYVDDTKGSQMYEQMYQQLAAQARSYSRKVPSRGYTFYRV